jgi:16S rRNA C967 or C1407 C5-methylase (RsmB/RsmF family)
LAWLGFQIYGIDAASGAAVIALGISAGDHVLDLCAAPGMYQFHIYINRASLLIQSIANFNIK